MRSQHKEERGRRVPPNAHIGVGGVDSYDLDQTVDKRGSKARATSSINSICKRTVRRITLSQSTPPAQTLPASSTRMY